MDMSTIGAAAALLLAEGSLALQKEKRGGKSED